MEDIKTTKVTNALYKNYVKKADECFDGMNAAFNSGNWNMSVIAAVHCGISSADALTVHFKGIRHSGQRHEDVVKLLNDLQVENIGKKIQQLLNLLRVKNTAEYEERLLTQSDASAAMRNAERFYKWTREMLKL